MSILLVLLLVPIAMMCLSWMAPKWEAETKVHGNCCSKWAADFFSLVRVLLQQDIPESASRWWRRGVLSGWMLVSLVLARSYASNLMSVLAVQHIQQPFQTLRDVLADPTVTMIWQTNSSRVQYFRAAESGVFREVAAMEDAGRIKFHLIQEFSSSMDTLVRRGDHVLVAVELLLSILIGHDFSRRGVCDFYTARERLLPVFLSMIGQKGSPIVPQLNKRILAMQESGLYDYWVKLSIPYSSSCANLPTRVTKSSSLSLPHLWGVFVVLAGSHALGLLLLVWEVVNLHAYDLLMSLFGTTEKKES